MAKRLNISISEEQGAFFTKFKEIRKFKNNDDALEGLLIEAKRKIKI